MNSVLSLAQWLTRRAALDGAKPALTFGDTEWTFRDFVDRMTRIATLLRSRGVKPGERIGYLGANHPDALASLFAATAAGAIFVPLNIRLAPLELDYIVRDAGIVALIGDSTNARQIDSSDASLPCRTWLSVDAPAPGWEDLDALVSAGQPQAEIHMPAPDDVAAIVYTSGTTGRPKGAILTHANLWSNDINWLTAFDMSSRDVTLVVAPLFHVSGLFVLTSITLMMGGRVVLLPGFDAGAVLDAVERHGATTTFGVPAMMLFLSEHERFGTADLSSLRLYVAGGAPVPEPILRRYADRGVPVSQCYGLSEAVSAAVFLETARGLDKLGSAGRAMLLAEMKLIDPDDNQITEPGLKGEICLRGGNISPGYWNNPEATAKTIGPDGWLRTGDVGFLDEEAFLFVCDRVKDMIISGGENVYPAEIESILLDHPAIVNVSVIGRADERWGERVVAAAVLRDGDTLDLETLQEFCSSRLARYKIPRELHLLPELPLNGSGKVVKAVLRTQLETADV